MILVRMSSAGEKVCCCFQERFTALMPWLSRSLASFDQNERVGIGDPRYQFQPRLPGSVVGEASILRFSNPHKSQSDSVLRSVPYLHLHVLFRGDQRMRNRMDGQGYPVLYTNFTHQLGHVCLYRALFNA